MKAKTFKNKLKNLVILSCLCFIGCNSNSPYKESISANSVDISGDFEIVATDNILKPNNENQSNISRNLKIIKSASARYKVKSVKDATRKIKKIAQKYGAYISDLRFENNLYKKENRFTIKVPKQSFDKVMDSVNAIVNFVEYENITTKDVTEEFIDLEARLETKLEIKKRYDKILRKNAKTVEDILKTEDKLRIIQEEIESSQGRLKYLRNKVAYSTIQIDLYEAVDYVEEPKSYKKTFLNESKEGLINGWSFIKKIIVLLINIWPLILLGSFALFILKKRFKQ